MELRLVPYTRREQFFCNIVINLSSDRPELSIIGVTIERHSKGSKDLISHNVTQGLYVSSLLYCGVGVFTRVPLSLYIT